MCDEKHGHYGHTDGGNATQKTLDARAMGDSLQEGKHHENPKGSPALPMPF
jgi:hypothetical protein